MIGHNYVINQLYIPIEFGDIFNMSFYCFPNSDAKNRVPTIRPNKCYFSYAHIVINKTIHSGSLFFIVYCLCPMC